MDTDALIRNLADDLRPVRRLPSPGARLVLWLVPSAVFVAVIVAAMSPRPDLLEKLSEGRFLLEQGAALATAVAAALAAFMASIPGTSRRVLLLPLIPLAIWIGSLGQGCARELLMLMQGQDTPFYPDLWCFFFITVVGAVPALLMLRMLRRGAPLMPHLTAAYGALAAAALANFGLRLFHAQDGSLMVMVWQFGSVALLAMLAGAIGQSLLGWGHRRTA